MIGVFLCAYQERHYKYNIVYNDVKPLKGILLCCDALDVDLTRYDYLLASPPCNYYSRANYRRDSSAYALGTKHLLPSLLIRFARSGKPFLIENVRNDKLFKKAGIYDICNIFGIYDYRIGRHTYFTNIMCNLDCPQTKDNITSKSYVSGNREGGLNVWNVFENFLYLIHDNKNGN